MFVTDGIGERTGAAQATYTAPELFLGLPQQLNIELCSKNDDHYR